VAFERLADRLPARRIPDPRRLVFRRGDDALSVGAERGAQYMVVMSCERLADRLAARGIPDPRRLVRRRGDNALAIRAERRAPHSVFMAQNEPLPQTAAGAIELQLRLGNVRPINSGGTVGQRLKRKQDCGGSVSTRALLAGLSSQESRLRHLQFAKP
jgi:hypothetical protein